MNISNTPLLQQGLFTFLLVILPILGFAQQVSFYATSDAKEVVKGGYVEVKFILENANGVDFRPPSFNGFKQVSGQNVSTKTSNVNGSWSRSTTYSFYLAPKKEGQLKIGKAKIKVSGKTYETEPLTIKVVKGKAQTEIEENEKIFFKAEIDKDSAVVGEPIIVDYVVYFAVNIDRFNIIQEPSFEGFYANMLRNYDGSTYKVVINGIQYGKRIIRRYIAYPQTPGNINIDPFTLRVSVPLNRNAGRRDPFAMLRPTESFILDSNPLEVEVSPLPSPVPPSFTNAIGKYNATAMLDKTSLTTDDAITMTLDIYGEGDIKRVTAPDLILSDSFEVYEPNLKQEDANEKNGKPYGKKTYEYLILPKATGQFTIAPEFSYYDVDSSKFVTATTATYLVNINKGVNPIRTNVKPVEETIVQQEIRPVKTSYTLSKRNIFVGSALFYGLIFLPFLILGAAIALRMYQKRPKNIDLVAEKRDKARKVAEQRLSVAHKHLKAQEYRPFYDETSKVLLGYVKDKFNIQGSELTKNNVKEHLSKTGANPEHISRFMSLLQTCEMAVFAQGSTENAQQVYNDAAQAIVDVEKA